MLTQPERETLIREYLVYAERLAHQIRRGLPSWVARDDLESAAREGLVEATMRYDPTRGATFKTFAYYRIRGAVFDHVRRSIDPVRNAQHPVNALAAVDDVVESTLGARAPTAGGSPVDAAETLATVLADAAVAFTLTEVTGPVDPPADTSSPESLAAAAETATWMRDVVGQLPERERAMVDGVYFRGLTIEQSGAELGVTKGWASRLHARALRLLREAASQRQGDP